MNAKLKYPLSDLNDYVSDLDLFIGCLSFEERCRSLAEYLSVVPKAVLLGEYDSVFGEAPRHRAYFVEKFGPEMQSILLSSDDPIYCADNLLAGLLPHITKPSVRILVDITTFTREVLMMLVAILANNVQDDAALMFAYVGAEKYAGADPTSELWNSNQSVGVLDSTLWLSRGVRDVRSVLGYPGELLPSRGNHLIVLAGFTNERVYKIVEHYEPAKISIGLGPESASVSASLSKLNRKFVKEATSMYANVDQFEIPVDDVLGSSQVIGGLANGSPYNTIVAPINTKISTVGAAVAALQYPKIQLVYAQPEVYNVQDYATPSSEFYLFRTSGSELRSWNLRALSV